MATSQNSVRIVLLLVSILGASFLLLCALLFSNFIGHGWQPRYDFALPFHVHASIVILVGLLGLAIRRYRSVLFMLSMVSLGTLVLTAGYVTYRWPGGDDGGGMAWIGIVAMGSLFATGMAVVGILAVRSARQGGDDRHVEHQTET